MAVKKQAALPYSSNVALKVLAGLGIAVLGGAVGGAVVVAAHACSAPRVEHMDRGYYYEDRVGALGGYGRPDGMGGDGHGTMIMPFHVDGTPPMSVPIPNQGGVMQYAPMPAPAN